MTSEPTGVVSIITVAGPKTIPSVSGGAPVTLSQFEDLVDGLRNDGFVRVDNSIWIPSQMEFLQHS